MWMRIDDKLHAHRKRHKAGHEAMGLWVLAGSWVADDESDGWIPDYVVASFAPNAEDLAARLVAAGFWIEGVVGGDRGWWFHDWTSEPNGPGWNPSVARLDEKRDEARERMRKNRAGKRSTSRSAGVRANTAGTTPARSRDVLSSHTHTHNQEPPRSSEVQGEHERDGSSDTPPAVEEEAGSAARKRSAPKRGKRLPADWQPTDADRAWFAEKCPTLAGAVRGREVTDNFRDYWHAESGARAAKEDWSKAWKVWVRREEGRAAQQAQRGPGGRPNADERVAEFARRTSVDPHAQPYDIPLPGTDEVLAGGTVHQLPRSDAR